MTPERRQGFTLLEILIVLAILSIIAGIFALNLMRTIRTNQVRDASYQIMTDLRKARTAAQKQGVPSTVTILPGTSTYTVTTDTTPPVTNTYTLPNGVRIQRISGDASVAYQPPYGTLGVNGGVWQLQSPANTGIHLYVNIVGVTGKVMLSATTK